MSITPVSPSQASDDVQKNYKNLQQALGSDTLPIFFTYLGAFPEYLDYITTQLTSNLSDPQFKKLTEETKNILITDISKTLRNSEQVVSWKQRNIHHPQYYNFQQNIDGILLTNIKLAYVFIALREAVKGWAVAAKKLPQSRTTSNEAHKHASVASEQLIYGNLAVETPSQNPASALAINETTIIHSNSGSIERDLLQEYIFLTQQDFNAHMNTGDFLELRIRQEKYVLSLLAVMPSLIFSPYNVIVPLIKKYDNFTSLLYLLSEHFPTYAMQRMLFSGYMKV